MESQEFRISPIHIFLFTQTLIHSGTSYATFYLLTLPFSVPSLTISTW